MTEELSEDEIKELEAKQLEITSRYTQTPEQDDLEQIQGEGSGEDTGEGEQGENQPDWMSFPIDPETGYRVDPSTGNYLDAETGELINKTVDAIPSDMN